MIWLSDGPKLSKTCVCADDVGSTLAQRRHLKIQYNIFRLCEVVSGMILKPSKCFLVITKVPLTEELVVAIRAWLRDNIPAWGDFQIVDTAKYLGVWIGRRGKQLTWTAPLAKFKTRVAEFFEGNAPSLQSVLRYNERALPVFSYVSQVCLPPLEFDMRATEQGSIHKILHLPPMSMSRELMHSLGDFVSPAPKCMSSLFYATMFRFAYNSKEFLLTLRKEALDYLGDRRSVLDFSRDAFPAFEDGNIAMLDELCQAIHFQGEFLKFLTLKEDITGEGGPTPATLTKKICYCGRCGACTASRGDSKTKSIQGLCYDLF